MGDDGLLRKVTNDLEKLQLLNYEEKNNDSDPEPSSSSSKNRVIEQNPHKSAEQLLNNILPSYQMYQSTISKPVLPHEENFKVDPPVYELTPISSVPTSVYNSGTVSPNNEYDQPNLLSAMVSQEDFGVFPEGQNLTLISQAQGMDGDVDNETNDNNTTTIYEETLLANVQKLVNLTRSDNEISQHVEIDIKVTKDVCEKGKKPELYDASEIEFKQGDYIHGYVTMRNTTNKPISFDMVYVLFEGSAVTLSNKNGFINPQKQTVYYRFLTMVDLYASWSYSNIDRLATDNGDMYDWCYGETDPYDGSLLAIDVQRMLQPNTTYKRFFTFRLPNKLLDDICEPNNFSSHTEIYPTFGVPKHTMTPSELLATREQQVRDFAFLDALITYSIAARIIGRASEYRFETPEGLDRYIVLKDYLQPIRVIPKLNPETLENKYRSELEADVFYRAFVNQIKEKIEFGHDLMSMPPSLRPVESSNLTPISSRDNGEKIRQLYDVADTSIRTSYQRNKKMEDANDMYSCLLGYRKKSLTGWSKTLGVVTLSTPKKIHLILYTPPAKFSNGRSRQTRLTVPFEFTFVSEAASGIKPKDFPEIKGISCELVVFSARLEKYSIPVELTYDMLFKEQEIMHHLRRKDPANFSSIVVEPMKQYFREVNDLIKKLGESFHLEVQLYRNLRCMATLVTKYINLAINSITVTSTSNKSEGHHSTMTAIPWEHVEDTVNPEYSLHSKKFELDLDIQNSQVKSSTPVPNSSFENFTLVPTFQTCHCARLYYLRVKLKLSNSDSLVVHVPVSIEN